MYIEKKVIPLPLIILFLVIAFFICLIASAWYFQTKLEELNNTRDEITSVKINNPVIIGVETNNQYKNYFIALSSELAKELHTEIEINDVQEDENFSALNNKQIDLLVTGRQIDNSMTHKYNILNSTLDYENIDLRLISRKEDTVLMNKIELAIEALTLKGVIADLNQKWLE